ncbi:hypothetical protein U1Q18_051689 [Sarracenia purpurea var. burkii]
MPMGIFPEAIIEEVTYLDSETIKDLNKSSGDDDVDSTNDGSDDLESDVDEDESGDEGEDEACAVGETNRPSSEVEDKVFVKMPRSESVV